MKSHRIILIISLLLALFIFTSCNSPAKDANSDTNQHDSDTTSEYICQHEDVDIVNFFASTCTVLGYSGDTVCLDCGETVESGEILETLAHSPMYTDPVPPTCTDNGISESCICTSCGETLEEAYQLDPLGHTLELVGYVEQTCTSGGYSGDLQCTECGNVLEFGVNAGPLGHNISYVNRVTPTCVSEGYSGDEYCNNCNILISAGYKIPKEEHWAKVINRKEPTCTEDGFSGDIFCEMCSTVTQKGAVIEKLNHSQREVRGQIHPTKTTEGYTGDIYCNFCDELMYYGEIVPVLPDITEINGNRTMELEILDAMNKARADIGLGPLAWEEALYTGVNIRANEYLYWNHDGGHRGDPHHRPNGDDYYTVLDEAGVGIGAYDCHGEILATSTSHHMSLFTAWMGSPGHKALILNEPYLRVAISVIYHDGVYYSCAIFGGKLIH